MHSKIQKQKLNHKYTVGVIIEERKGEKRKEEERKGEGLRRKGGRGFFCL